MPEQTLEQIAEQTRNRIMPMATHWRLTCAPADVEWVILAALRQAQQIERERCARIAEDEFLRRERANCSFHSDNFLYDCNIADAIRTPEHKDSTDGSK